MAAAGFAPSVEVEGGRELRRALANFAEGAGSMKEVNQSVADLVSSAAAERAPWRSHDLAGTVRGRALKTGAYVAAGLKRVPYAGPIHFGWYRHHIDPQPFLYEALDSRRAEVIATYSAGVDKLVGRFTAEAPHLR